MARADSGVIGMGAAARSSLLYRGSTTASGSTCAQGAAEQGAQQGGGRVSGRAAARCREGGCEEPGAGCRALVQQQREAWSRPAKNKAGGQG